MILRFDHGVQILEVDAEGLPELRALFPGIPTPSVTYEGPLLSPKRLSTGAAVRYG